MEGTRFDSLARALQSRAARRSTLGLLVGSAIGLLELTSSEAKGKKGKKIALCLNGQTLSVKKSKKGREITPKGQSYLDAAAKKVKTGGKKAE